MAKSSRSATCPGLRARGGRAGRPGQLPSFQPLPSRPPPRRISHPRHRHRFGVGGPMKSSINLRSGSTRPGGVVRSPAAASLLLALAGGLPLRCLRRLRVPAGFHLHRVADRGLSCPWRPACVARLQEERPSQGGRHGGIDREHRPPHRRKRAPRTLPSLSCRMDCRQPTPAWRRPDRPLQPETLFLMARRSARPAMMRTTPRALRWGPVRSGSGTAYLMRSNCCRISDLAGLDLKPSSHDLEAQAQLVRDGAFDLAASAERERRDGPPAGHKDDLFERSRRYCGAGGATRAASGRILAGCRYRQADLATDKLSAVDIARRRTAVAGIARERVAFLMPVLEEFHRPYPPLSAKSVTGALVDIKEAAMPYSSSGDKYLPACEPDAARPTDLLLR